MSSIFSLPNSERRLLYLTLIYLNYSVLDLILFTITRASISSHLLTPVIVFNICTHRLLASKQISNGMNKQTMNVALHTHSLNATVLLVLISTIYLSIGWDTSQSDCIILLIVSHKNCYATIRDWRRTDCVPRRRRHSTSSRNLLTAVRTSFVVVISWDAHCRQIETDRRRRTLGTLPEYWRRYSDRK